MALTKMSLPMTSSFFCSSPVVLEEPARPESCHPERQPKSLIPGCDWGTCVNQRRSADVVGDTLERELQSMAQKSVRSPVSRCYDVEVCDAAYVKSPVASLCLTCSSVKNLVRVTMSVLIFSWPTGPSLLVPLVVMSTVLVA